MLAPVLARLLAISGIDDARVDCSGSYFLVAGADADALERALPIVRDILGPRTRRLEGAAREAQLVSRPRGELWFSREDIRALSYVEGRVLTVRMADAVASKIALEGRDADQVLEAIRAEIFAALDHAHDTGGRSTTGWFWEEWPRIVERVVLRLEGTLPAPHIVAVASALRVQGDGCVR